MTRHFTRWSVGVAALATAGWLLAAPAGAQERGGARGGGGSGGGTAVSRGDTGGSSSGGASSGGSNTATSSSGGSSSAPVVSGGGSNAGGGSRPSGRDFAVSRGGARAEGARATHGEGGSRGDRSSEGAVAREPMRGGSGDATSAPRTGDYAAPRDSGKGRQNAGAGDGGVPQYSRPRPPDRAPIGTAVPRGTVPPPSGGRGGNVVTGVPWYYPWGYGSLGYYGWYDPYYDPYGGGYGGYYPSGSSSYDEGSLRLKVKPREAEVFVDGYYVGLVNDFDGIFQRLHVDAGPHHLEIRAPGYETLEFDVHVDPDRTLTYTGELKKLP